MSECGASFIQKASYTSGTSGYWTIPDVEYRGQRVIVDLMQGVLPVRTQEEHARHFIDAQQRGDFHVADLPLYMGIFRKVCQIHERGDVQEKEMVENIQGFLKKQLEKYSFLTLTRIFYNPEALDFIYHGYALPAAYSYQNQVEVVGKNGVLEEVVTHELGEVLLGTPRIEEVVHALRWIMGDSLKIWRMNQRPLQSDARVARFVAGSGGADLGCYWDPTDSNSGLGVRFRRQKNLADTYGIVIDEETQFYPYGTPTDWERQRIANLILEQKGMNEADLHGLRRTLENYINRNGGKNE